MKKKMETKKLSLVKETVVNLREVVGGVIIEQIGNGYSECETCNPR